MNRYGERFTAYKQIMDRTARTSAVCCIGIPILFVLAMGLIVAFGFRRYWYLALAAMALLALLFFRSSRSFKERGGNSKTLEPYTLPTEVSSPGGVLNILSERTELFETDNSCSYCFLRDQRPVRIMLFPISSFDPDTFRETYQEAICQILEGPRVPSDVRADQGHSELRIHLILAERRSPELEDWLSQNAYHTMSEREGAMTAALLLSERKLLVSAFFGDHYGDAKKYYLGCGLLQRLFAAKE